MANFAAMVRIGDPVENKTLEQVHGILALHVETSCWSSASNHELSAGMPVIASHTGAGRGLFLVGVSTGERLERLPWNPAVEHIRHIGYRVQWMNAVFEGDVAAIPGAERRTLQWLTDEDFNVAMSRLTAQAEPATPSL